MNEELINTAVSFLKDPKVGSSPLNKKVEFLEAKGLSQEEIEEALRRANGQSSTENNGSNVAPSSSYQPMQANYQQPPIDYYNVVPQVPDRSWKDYFIMATATAGVTYGLYQVFTKYLVPSILPPTQKSIDDDKEKVNEEFLKIDKLLEQMSVEQEEIKTSNENKLKEIDVMIENVNDFLSKFNKDKLKFDDDLRLMKLEVDNLRNTVEKNMSATKENLKDELHEIVEELSSLKNLIKTRAESSGPEPSRKIAPASSIPSASEILKKASSSNSSTEKVTKSPEPLERSKSSSFQTSSIPGFTPGIPEWQLKHKQKEEEIAQGKVSNETHNNASDKESEDKSNNINASASSESVSGITAEEKNIKEKISKVGVPSWQLNAKANT